MVGVDWILWDHQSEGLQLVGVVLILDHLQCPVRSLGLREDCPEESTAQHAPSFR